MHDVRETIRNSRPEGGALAPLDVEEVARRGRRRTVVHRASAVVATIGLLAGVALTLDALDLTAPVEVEPIAPEGPTTDAGEPTLDETIDALIAANRTADARPAPRPGQLLVEWTWNVWAAGSTSEDGTTTFTLEAGRYETRTDADGTTEIVRMTFGTVTPTDSLAELRAEAGRYFDDPPETTDDRFEGTDPQEHAERALQEAEADSHGSAEPAPGRTERPDQAHAFMRAADALRVGLQPEDRIRALEAIRRIDDSLVEYRGRVPDLLGREGVAIAGRDGDGWDAPQWHVLIFDPETGDLLGEYQEIVDPTDGAPPIMSYTARETLLVDRD